MAMDFGKSTITLLLTLALAMALGCGSGTEKAGAKKTKRAKGSSTAAIDPNDPQQVRDAIMAQIIPGIEGAFRSRNAKARWEGSVLHVKMDAKPDDIRPGWTECRVLSHFLKDGQTAVLEFPSGPLQCTEVLNVQ